MLSKYKMKAGTRNVLRLVVIWGVVQAIVIFTGAINFDSILPYICFLLLAKKTDLKWNNIIYTKVISIVLTLLIYYNLLKENLVFMNSIQGKIGAALVMLIFLVKINANVEELLITKSKLNLISVVGAILFSLFAAVGNIEVFEGMLQNYKITGSFVLAITVSLLCWWILFYICFENFYYITGDISKNVMRDETNKTGKRIHPLMIGGLSFLVFLLCWFPYFLTYYPGVMEYDSWVQMMQVLGQPYSNHHPWLQTIIIKGVYELGWALWNSENRGIALYVCCSMSFLAFSLSVAMAFLYKNKVKISYLMLLLLLFALSPINGMYSINMWKDIPFAAVFLLVVIILASMKQNIDKGLSNNKEWVLFIPLSFALCFLRGNGLYIFLFLVPFIMYTFRKQMRKAIAAIAIVLVLGILYKGPVFDFYHVKDADTVASLSIPVQQIAAVISYNGEITDEQQETLAKVVSLEEIPQYYLNSPGCSDDINDLIRLKDNQEYIQENPGTFLKTWIDIGWQNKYLYVKAYVNETKGYWHHKTTYPFLWATYINDNGSGITRESKVPKFFADFMSKYIKGYEKHFWKYYGNAFYIHLLFLSMAVAIRNKSKHLLIYLPVIGLWITLLIATPVVADFRYAYANFLAVPVIIYITILKAGNRSYIGDKLNDNKK